MPFFIPKKLQHENEINAVLERQKCLFSFQNKSAKMFPSRSAKLDTDSSVTPNYNEKNTIKNEKYYRTSGYKKKYS